MPKFSKQTRSHRGGGEDGPNLSESDKQEIIKEMETELKNLIPTFIAQVDRIVAMIEIDDVNTKECIASLRHASILNGYITQSPELFKLTDSIQESFEMAIAAQERLFANLKRFTPFYVPFDVIVQFMTSFREAKRAMRKARTTKGGRPSRKAWPAVRPSRSSKSAGRVPKWLPTDRTVVHKGKACKLWRSAADPSVLAVKRMVKAADGTRKCRFEKV